MRPKGASWAKPRPYKVNMYTFNDGQPEEFLALLRNWKITTDRTGTTSPSG